jgi:hypothetical protein
MNKLFSFLIVFLLAGTLQADDISAEKALSIAERFFAGQPASTKANARSSAKASTMNVAYTSLRKSGSTALYVINRGSDEGFVLVSADSDTDRPVLGWSDNGSFDYDKAPIQLRDMLEAYSQSNQHRITDTGISIDGLVELQDSRIAIPSDDGQNQALRTIPLPPAVRNARRRVESVPNVVVAPLVKVHWNQTGEYARYVDPYYSSNAGIAAGCVPAAMAQIMAFWKYPARGRGFHLHNILDTPDDIDMEKLAIDYATGRSDELKYVIQKYSRPYKVNFSESVYKWDEMGSDQPTTDAQCDNVAKLIFDCHVSCSPAKMSDNRGTGSSISQAANSMVRYFGYNPDMEYIECKGNEDLLRQELDAGRPILMDGDPSAGFNNDGHAFVCDGYAKDDYFHFNFGWSGSGDGYYLLNHVRPSTSDFSYNQHAYIGICPSLATSESGNAYVNVTPDGVGVVVGGPGNVVVPATVESGGKSYPVMKVKSYAFSVPSSNYGTWLEEHVKEYVTGITLPESITEIGEMAFPSSYLKEVSLGSNIRKIGVSAFFHSRYLEKVSIPSIEAWLNIDFEPNVLESGFPQYMSNPIWNTDNSFKGRLYIGDKEATDIVIPASVKEVRSYAFCGYQFLNSVTFEEGVEKIGTSAFERVPLKSFNLPSTVKEIGAKAFYNHQTSTITIPAGLSRVGNEALWGNYISEYIVAEDNPIYSAYQGVLYDRSRRTLVHCPNYRPGFTEGKVRNVVGVPSSVNTIRAHSFGDNLEKLTLPPSVRSIEDEAFVSTNKLKDLYLYTMQPVPITSTTFSGNATSMYNKVNVHVPVGAGDAYRAAPVWQDMNIIEDQAAGSMPPEHYDYTTDFNAIEIADWDDQDQWQVAQYHYFLFDLHPVVTFSGTSMLITTDKERYVIEKEHYLRSPYRFHFRFAHYDDPTAIDDVQTNDRHAVFRTVGNQLVISGLDANTPVVLYSTDGRLLVAAKASARGEVSIGIPAVGVIVVKAGKYSFKIHAKR